MDARIESIRQRMVSHDKVIGLKLYLKDDIKKGEKFAIPLPRWISGDTYEGQMYDIAIATEDIKKSDKGIEFMPYTNIL
jgi:hypothetical protein